MIVQGTSVGLDVHALSVVAHETLVSTNRSGLIHKLNQAGAAQRVGKSSLPISAAPHRGIRLS